jgi:hypothetical protein
VALLGAVGVVGRAALDYFTAATSNHRFVPLLEVPPLLHFSFAFQHGRVDLHCGPRLSNGTCTVVFITAGFVSESSGPIARWRERG